MSSLHCLRPVVYLLILLIITACSMPSIKRAIPPETSTARDSETKPDSPTGLYQFRGNNTRSFYGTGPLPEKQPKIIWKFKTDVIERQSKDGTVRRWQGLGWTGQPAIVPEKKKRIVYAASLDGFVYKLDFLTGALILRSPQNFDIIKSSPTITDNYAIVGSWSNGMHILDRETLRHLHSEEAVYTPSVSYDFDGSAAVEDGHAYFAGEDGYVRKLQLKPPFKRIWLYPESAPKSKFRYKGRQKPYVGIESSVAIYGNQVIVGSGSGHVFYLDKTRGVLQADFNTGDDTDSSPLIDVKSGDVYIGVERDFNDRNGGLFKLDSKSNEQWFFQVGATGIYSSAAFFKDDVIFTADDGYLYSVSKEQGKLNWRVKIPGRSSWSSPVVIGNRVLTADFGGYLALFDAVNGKMLWKKKFPSYFVGTPAVWDGVIVVGCRDGYIYALK